MRLRFIPLVGVARLVLVTMLLLGSALIVGYACNRPGGSVATQPVARWDFQEMGGTVVSDEVIGLAGALQNVHWRMLDGQEACLEFEGNPDSRVTVSPNGALNLREATISCWFNIWWGEARALLVYKPGVFRLRLYRHNQDCVFWDEDGTEYDLGDYPISATYIPPSEWHHLVMTYSVDRAEAAVYLDGQRVAVMETTGRPLERSVSEIYMGAASYNDYMGGLIDDVRIYDAPLPARQVKRLYAERKNLYGDTLYDSPGRASRGSRPPNLSASEYPLYDAWFSYRPVVDDQLKAVYGQTLGHIVVQGDHPTVRTAGDELAYALKRLLGRRVEVTAAVQPGGNVVLGTPATSPLIAGMREELRLDQAGEQGFVIKSVQIDGQPALVVAANTSPGLIQGTFALIRRLQLRQSIAKLDLAERPKTTVRMVNHWDNFRGFVDEQWLAPLDPQLSENDRDYSIFGWRDLREGRIARIEQWARLLASAGFNAICPTDVNWSEKNNFLKYLPEVKVLAAIFRKYGIRLYWTPNYLFAPLQSTADSLYRYVPDFGGYLLKLGSEGQAGSPGPENVNAIARILAPSGGQVLIRAFVYGPHFQTDERHREKIPYLYFAPRDGQYDDNVIVVGKFTPLDFEVREPINALDGALKQTRYGAEVMIAKWFPMSWLEAWQRWLDFDNHRNGPGSYNRDCIDGVLGVSMISPLPGWTSNPLNMVNYYGLGRLAWNPERTAGELHDEWISLTFGDDREVRSTVQRILARSDEMIENLTLYHGYRGLWLRYRLDELRKTGSLPYPMRLEADSLGADGIGTGLAAVYAPEVRRLYEDPVRSEDLLLAFRVVPYTYRLTNGRTVIRDIYHVHNAGVRGADELLALWRTLKGRIDDRYYQDTETNFNAFTVTARARRNRIFRDLSILTGIAPE